MTDADVPPTADAAHGLRCPLCDYDLRGLTEPRCPECGFAFTWAELADRGRNAHRYLFEHATRRRAAAYLRTYWRTWRPRLFWREVSPAHAVAAGRLVLYWAVAQSVILLAFAGLLTTQWVTVAGLSAAQRCNTRPSLARSGWSP